MKRVNIIILSFLFFGICNSIFSQNDKDSPRDGEGIHSFLKRNNRIGNNYYEQFLELNKNKLGKRNTLLKGVTYTLPSISKGNKEDQLSKKSNNKESSPIYIEPLFGSAYEQYTIKSNKLKGACFYLSSGHGGPDPGAIGKVDGYSLHEHEYAYDITLRLARCLQEEGATVHIIIQDTQDGIRDDRYLSNSDRATCMGETIPLNQLKRLEQRSNKINDLARKTKEKYKRAVFIHLDSRSQKKQLDVFFYYAKNSSGGKKLAKTMQETFASHYDKHQPNRGFTGTVSMRELYVLTNTTPVGIYAELGNIQNSFDQRRFLDPNNRQALANWMCRGFIKDYDNWKKGR
ncbi:N-acetylmuramoyl-L-alanine amidase [Dysgonomonas sp. Marseille-P4677]|uniref:N-acetylmuramoyl-L-alanine amidase family protein n=1 Tax=Dysgonomonas sp. Marseille-P4677 TaxID=2364790 RepID=UPI00191372FD|nr:N-acetylmuramoyl-L-alanine amidase [Dysgonomonas sp. Marseille-P4677]MBK5720715.1 N-acetylmuramoyl-L-alanine amidase [Dysgonomonas sp. Marseille-P4677]